LPDPNLGLRERKKLRTRATIQREALRLFLKQGFDETTIEEIAEAAEISPSTFFNYFPSKEAVVFEDELDPLILAAFDAQPPGTHPIRALRNAMMSVFANLTPEQDRTVRQRIELLARTPALRSEMLSEFAALTDQIADLLATQIGRPKDDFVLHNLAGAVLGVLMSVMIAFTANPKVNVVDLVDESLAHLEAGLPLDWPQR
jgi:AcrR family transcriptional regulator